MSSMSASSGEMPAHNLRRRKKKGVWCGLLHHFPQVFNKAKSCSVGRSALALQVTISEKANLKLNTTIASKRLQLHANNPIDKLQPIQGLWILLEVL